MHDTKLLQKKITKLVAEHNIEKNQKQEIENFVMKYGCVNDKTDDWLRETKESLVKFKHQQKLVEDDYKDNDKIIVTEDDRVTLKKFINCTFEKNQDITVFDPLDMLQELIDVDYLEVDNTDMFGRTPFHYAVISGSLSCMDMLLDSNKVNINLQDNDKV